MRITMVCIGSTGDVRPYIVLARELKARGHDIAICAFASFADTVQREGLRFMPINGDVKDFMAKLLNGSSGVQYLKQVKEAMVPYLGSFLTDLENACADADAIISTYFGEVVKSIAEVRHVPFIQTHFYPMDKNPETPIASAPGQRAGKAWNLASYQIGYFAISVVERYYLADWRQAHGMSPRKLESTPNYELNGHIIPVLYAMSPLVMPRPTSWGANIHMTGYWLDNRQSSDYQPEPELAAFLEKGPKPVYIGFGSMVSGDMDETLSIVLEAVKRSGVRAVLARGWGGGDVSAQGRDDVYMTGFVPHDWLFQQVCAVVHHGGAGTLAAGLLAGKPTLVIPFGGDQPFWANRVREMGVGPNPIPREKLTVARLTKALMKLTTTKKYSVAAREIGLRLRMENGAHIAADIIEHELRKWLREEGREPVLVRPDDNPQRKETL